MSGQRTLGDLSWINDYVGIPWKLGGRDRHGLDCYGLLCLVYLERYDYKLPDMLDASTASLYARSDMIDATMKAGNWCDVEEPENADIVICRRHRAAHHMGLYYGGGILHCDRGLGSVYEPLTRFQKTYPNTQFGEWYPWA